MSLLLMVVSNVNGLHFFIFFDIVSNVEVHNIDKSPLLIHNTILA